MGCFNLALNLLDVSFDKIYVSEVDKFAIAEDKENHPNNIHMGDVTKWREWDINWTEVDLVVGGSPCQGFSSAGKQHGTKAVLNGKTYIVSSRGQYLYLKSRGAEFLSQSYLFWEYVLLLDWVKINNPSVKFMLENVKMSKGYLDMISGAIDCNPVFINSALMTAQNRQRFYWCNSDQEIPQPEDKGILLKDIIEDIPINPTIMSDKFTTRQRGRKCLVDNLDRKASNLSAMEYVKNGRQGDYIRCGSMVGSRINKDTGVREDWNKEIRPVQVIEIRSDEKTNCLSTVQKDNVIVLRDKSKRVRASGRNSVDRHEWDSISDCHYRKLTVIECCRLQSVPDDYFKVSSPTQAYKMLGNGWTVVVIAHILKHLLNVEYRFAA